MKIQLLLISVSTITLLCLNGNYNKDTYHVNSTVNKNERLVAANDTVIKGATVPLLSLIKVGEAGKRGYDSYNRGSKKCRASNKERLAITNMTVGKVMELQSLPTCSKSKLHAVGMHQIIQDTMSYCVNVLGIPKSRKLTPDLQNYIFANCLAGKKRPAIEHYIKSGEGIVSAAHSVSEEWAAFKSPILGRGVHDHIGINKATIGYKKVFSSLNLARSVYQEEIKKGSSQKQAYAKALGVNNAR